MKKKKKDGLTSVIVVACALTIAALCGYLLYNYWYLPMKIEKENRRYAEMYVPRTEQPTAEPTAKPTAEPTAGATTEPTAGATAKPTAKVTAEPTVRATAEPTAGATAKPTAEATVAPIAEPTVNPTIAPTATLKAPVDVPMGTLNPETIVYTAVTPPPTLEAFDELINTNPETAGFLTVGENLRLPVVQKSNDNEYYLSHNFEGGESSSGCLFIDGSNRIYPSDDCIYVYGHNMKNGTMFGNLSDFSKVSVLKKNPVAYFDTIYETGTYVPFACFALTADQSAANYFEIRRFEFTDESFNEYAANLKSLSDIMIPVSVEYGDRLLLLVTCNYSINDGRFVVALRRLRANETEQTARALVGQSEKK